MVGKAKELVMSQNSTSGRSRSRPLVKKLLFAAVTTFSFFALLELLLAVVGVEPVTQNEDPFVGFAASTPLFVPDELDGASSEARVRTAPGKQVWFNDQSFARRKGEKVRRVFCVGGSTTYGRPFDDATSYCGWLRRFLPLVDPGRKWEVINAGGISYASYRVARLMEELAQYEPDLFIVYSSHNEFLERRTYASMFDRDRVGVEVGALLQRSRAWSVVRRAVGRPRMATEPTRERLPGEVDEILNHSSGPSDYHRDPTWTDHVTRHYEWNVNRMISIAREAGAEIVFVTPASNLRDCSPFRSDPSEELTAAQADECHSILDLAESELREQNSARALALVEPLVRLDPLNARCQFLFGQCLFAAGRYQEAEAAFQQAVDQDVCPLRATSKIKRIVRDVTAQRRVALVDFEAKLRQLCVEQHGHACFGREHFLDHVHPTIDVHRRIALWTIDELLRIGWLDGQMPTAGQIDSVENQVESIIDLPAQGIAFRNLAKVLHWAGKFEEAAPRARDAIRLLPDDLESRLILADCLQKTGHPREAMDQYEQLFRIGDYPRACLPFGELLIDQAEFELAKPYLLRAVLSDRKEDRARAYYSLGLAHLRLREFAFAVESFQELDRELPDNPTTLSLLAEAELGRGNWQEAIDGWNRVIQLDPENADAHIRLAEVLGGQQQFSEAIRHLDAALRLQPNNREAQALRGQLDSREGSP
jgi:tetratricopeptide (TPR) repeat protein